MYTRGRGVALATALALALTVAVGCEKGPPPEAQQLATVTDERDRLVQEMAENARLLSEISSELAKVQVPARQLKVSAESPLRASRDTMIQKIRYVTSRMPDLERRLRQSRERIEGLSQVSDSLRATLEATIANYDTIVASQKATIASLTDQVTQLSTENVALKDTVNTMSQRINTVYYVIGTKEELLERGVVTEEGGARFLFVLWRHGRSLTPARELDPAQFTAISKRETTTIRLPDPAASYRVVSRQNLDALATPRDGDGTITGAGSLRIEDPEGFWSTSKFLILVQR